jgi:hypothetical protein
MGALICVIPFKEVAFDTLMQFQVDEAKSAG